MADETTTTTANDVYFAAWVGDAVLDEIRPYNVSKPLFRFEGRRESLAFDFPIQDDPGAATAQTEGATIANTALATSKATATAALVGQKATVTDLLAAVTVVDALSHFSGVLGRSVAEKQEVDRSGILDDFSNVTGTSGADLTVAQFLSAISALEQRDALGDIVSVLHPVQVGDLRSGVQVTANAHWQANPNFSPTQLMDTHAHGLAGNLFGVEIYQTSAIPTANLGADRAGGMFVKGVAVGLYELWDTRIETHRVADGVGTQVVATSAYGVVEIRDSWGQTITTDA